MSFSLSINLDKKLTEDFWRFMSTAILFIEDRNKKVA